MYHDKRDPIVTHGGKNRQSLSASKNVKKYIPIVTGRLNDQKKSAGKRCYQKKTLKKFEKN